MIKKCYNFVFRRKLSDICIIVYLLTLFILPDDPYKNTSIFTFQTPRIINYKWKDFYISWLLLPMIVIGLYCFFARRNNMQKNIFIFLFALLVKDSLCFLFGNTFILTNKSWELYWIYICAGCMVYIFYYYINNYDDIKCLWFIFSILTLFTLYLSIVLRITPGIYDYVNRYSSTNISHGETCFVLGISIIYFLSIDIEQKLLLTVFFFLGIIATGSRKDIFYIIIVIFLKMIISTIDNFRYFSINSSEKQNKRKIKNRNTIIITIILLILFLFLLLFYWENIVERLNIDRYLDLLNVFNGITDYIINDYSGEGRINSLESGFKVLQENLIFGVNFSFYNEQYQIQEKGYPTFPHQTVLFNWIIMGLLVLIPIFTVFHSVIILIKNRDELMYMGIYYILYHIISGGAWSSYKIIFINLFLVWMFIYNAKKYIKKPNKKTLLSKSKMRAHWE